MGHSAHGYYALELARLLIQNGQEVAFLGLLDTYPPSPKRWTNLKDWVKFHIYNLQNKKIPEILQDFGQSIQGFSMHMWHQVSYSQEKKVIESQYSLLAASYKPEAFDGRVILFSTNHRNLYINGNPMGPWANIFTGQFEIVHVPGNHFTMFKSPYVAVLADKIKSHLPPT